MSDPKPHFQAIPSHPSFPQIEEEMLAFWKEHKTFEKSIETKSEDNPYRFYDGPPFKNGTPHYGSLLQSFIKDAIPRFWTMKGKRVERKWGRDCHGIYIEQKVQNKLGLTSNKDIEKYGVQKFIEACREFTSSVVDEREWCVDHIGRWVDFHNPYQTMDNDYMESVRWVFKNLRYKRLIYKGKRVSMYSTKLNTAISSFEVQADNSYAEIADPAITVKFSIVGEDKKAKENSGNGEVFEETSDGFTRYIQAVIKNKDGGVLSLYNIKHGGRQLPGGKINKGEDEATALQREINEELGIQVKIGEKIGGHKDIRAGYKMHIVFYEAEIISGEPVIQETDKHTAMGYAKIETSDNDLGRNYVINGTIIEEVDEIRIFKDLFHLKLIEEHKNYFSDSENDPFSFLARTTTPRSIPANLALVVNPEIMYVQLFDLEKNEYFILAENLVSKYYKNPQQFLIIYKCKGTELEDISYKPPFDFYINSPLESNENHFKIYLADYVTDTDGTGIVHTAPEFGEDDFKTGIKYGLVQTEALDEAGNYTNQVYNLETPDLMGVYYRDANDMIMEKLKSKELLFKKESITHTVAICPRTQVPLIFKTQDSWFINIQSVKEKLIEKCKEINRIPDHLRLGRFLKNIETAPDRCISRTRYRATPMPVWTDGNGNNKVIGSMEELFKLDQTEGGSNILEKKEISGKTIYRDRLHNQEFDFHRPYIDAIFGYLKPEEFDNFEGHYFTDPEDNATTSKRVTRVSEVLDPWLDSGSMPYAQSHYPFEDKEKFDNSFPADFIGEGLGQIRAWFYVMHTLGVLLFDSSAYKNVICTGTILGNDGRKMSKTFGNYPDIKPTIEKFGADAIRMLYAGSPVLNGGDQPFTEELVREIIKKIHLPLRNSFSFFTTYANIDNFIPTKFSINDMVETKFENDLDTWIIGKTARLISEVNKHMESYTMQKATVPIYEFMNDLTNRYIRRSRRRFWKGEMDNEKLQGYETLFVVLVELCKVLAPFMPFLSDYIFKILTGKESVHLEDRTDIKAKSDNTQLLNDMDLTKEIVELGLSLRGSLKIKVKQPLQKLTINKPINPSYEPIILEELNVKELIIDESLNTKIKVICVPNAKILGKKLGARFAEINNMAKEGQFELLSDKTAKVSDIVIQSDEYELRYEKGDLEGDLITQGNLVLILDTTISPQLKLEGFVRELIRSIQEARKTAGYEITDRISLSVSGYEADQIIEKFGTYIASETLATLVPSIENADFSGECDVDEGIIGFSIKK